MYPSLLFTPEDHGRPERCPKKGECMEAKQRRYQTQVEQKEDTSEKPAFSDRNVRPCDEESRQ